jgi:glycosyltransferase involved in cell wall biosynthesis
MSTRGATVVCCILTKDEAANIERALASVLAVVDEAVVVDSGSEDGTPELAKACGSRVLTHPFEGYAAQRNWALDRIAEDYGCPWVLTLDADEWLSAELRDELRALRPRLDELADVYLLRRRTRFAGRVLRRGGFGATWLARLVRSDYARYEDRGVNEHLAIPEDARVARLANWLEHADVASWERYIDKHNRYSTLEARARLLSSPTRAVTARDALRDPTLRKRFLRHRVYDRLPGRPALRFLGTYLVLGGFLDGRAGFDRALFEAWQELCIDLKVRELRDDDMTRPRAPKALG